MVGQFEMDFWHYLKKPRGVEETFVKGGFQSQWLVPFSDSDFQNPAFAVALKHAGTSLSSRRRILRHHLAWRFEPVLE